MPDFPENDHVYNMFVEVLEWLKLYDEAGLNPMVLSADDPVDATIGFTVVVDSDADLTAHSRLFLGYIKQQKEHPESERFFLFTPPIGDVIQKYIKTAQGRTSIANRLTNADLTRPIPEILTDVRTWGLAE
jgi:hypothetical protein